jgi:hypothetical protein
MIEPMVESKWIRLMVVKENKIRRIEICVDLRTLNDACSHYPFPT